MINPTDPPVVVGVDGSARSREAVAVAVREARLHRRPLRLVHAFEWPLLGVYLGPSPEGPPEGGLAAEADRILAEGLAHAAEVDRDLRADDADELPVIGEVITGQAATVLLREAQQAALVVLGDRGLGGFSGLLIGSVAVQLSAHAPGPVLVVRGEQHAGPLVLGVDGSQRGSEAVAFAFAEAAARGVELLAISAWSARPSVRAQDELPLVYDASDIESAQVRLLREALAGARERWPQVRVREQVIRGRPARVLIDASADAQLVVVGARGRGGFTGLLLGSVSQALLYHSHCPVAVVRQSQPD